MRAKTRAMGELQGAGKRTDRDPPGVDLLASRCVAACGRGERSGGKNCKLESSDDERRSERRGSFAGAAQRPALAVATLTHFSEDVLAAVLS